MTRAGKKPQVSPRAALLFQSGIGAVGLAAILVLGIPVQNEGMSLSAALVWGLTGSVATYGVIMLVSRIPGLAAGETAPLCV